MERMDRTMVTKEDLLERIRRAKRKLLHLKLEAANAHLASIEAAYARSVTKTGRAKLRRNEKAARAAWNKALLKLARSTPLPVA